MKPAQPRLTYAPLVRFVGVGDSSSSIAAAIGRHPTTVRNYRQDGIPEQEGDKIAVYLGVHPSAIWGDAWFTVTEQVQV